MLFINKLLLLDERNQLWIGIALLALVGVAVFFPVVNFQFLSDDWDLVYHADKYQSFADRFVFNDHQTTEGYSYRPIVGIYLAVLRSLFGLDPAGFHAFFVFVHILNAVLVFFLAKRLLFFERSAGGVEKLHDGTSRLHSKSIVFVSFVAALVFLLLPAHAEAVFWISAGADVVATMFFLLSLLFFIQYISIRHPALTVSVGSRNKQQKEKDPIVISSGAIAESRNLTQKDSAPIMRSLDYARDDNSVSFRFLGSSLKTGMTYYFFSIIFFIFGLLTKEIVVTLPIVLYVLFFSCLFHDKKRYVTEWRDRHMSRHIFFSIWKTTVPFFVITGAYLFLRWNATGALFGYYGRPNVGVDVGQWVRMAADILSSFFVWGDTRLKLAELFRTQFHWLIVLLAFVALYIKKFHREYPQVFFVIFLLFVFSALPVLPLGFNPLSDEGERYGYLPSLFFVILSVFILYIFIGSQGSTSTSSVDKMNNNVSNVDKKVLMPELVEGWNKRHVVYVVVSFLCLIYFGYGLLQKTSKWEKYQDANYQILNQLYQLNDERKMVVVGLPDSYYGVQGFRNGIEEAYKLYYGEDIEIDRVPVYTVDGGKVNHESRIMNLELGIMEKGLYTLADGFDESIPNQLFLKTQDKSLRLTGEKEYEDEYVDVDFFRWHYDINRADGMTVKLKERLVEDIQAGKVSLVLFDGIRIVRVFSSL